MARLVPSLKAQTARAKGTKIEQLSGSLDKVTKSMAKTAEQMQAMLETQARTVAMFENQIRQQSQLIEGQRAMMEQMVGREMPAPTVNLPAPEMSLAMPEVERPDYWVIQPSEDDDDITICRPVYASEMN